MKKIRLLIIIGIIVALIVICPGCDFKERRCFDNCYDEKMSEPCEQGDGLSGALTAYLNCKDVRKAECRVDCR